MIVILCEPEAYQIAKDISADLVLAYKDQLQIAILMANDLLVWPAEYSWDDLLIVIYRDADFSECGKKFIKEYLDSRGQNSFILPIAANPANKMPPEPISGIKAIPYDDRAKGEFGRIANRVGAILGLRIRHRDHKIFISYREVDGNFIAERLYEFLEGNGFNPWRDEAKDRHDGEPNIPAGTNVQAAIENNLKDANLIVLIDTPRARESRWLKLEIDTANAHLIPILPVCFWPANDPHRGPRFRSLRELQRWIDVSWVNNGKSIEDNILLEIMNKMERYLSDIYRRKLRVPYLVKDEFTRRGFSWQELDPHKYIYDSLKKIDRRVRIRALSHCSIFDEIYTPALNIFTKYCEGSFANFLFFIYDGEVLPLREIEDLCDEVGIRDVANLIILHNQELSALFDKGIAEIS